MSYLIATSVFFAIMFIFVVYFGSSSSIPPTPAFYQISTGDANITSSIYNDEIFFNSDGSINVEGIIEGNYTETIEVTTTNIVPVTVITSDFEIQSGITVMPSGSASHSIVEGTDFEKCENDCFLYLTNSRNWGGMGRTASGGSQNADDVTAYVSDFSGLDNDGQSITFTRHGTANDNRIAWQIVEYVGSSDGNNRINVLDHNICMFGSSATCTGNAVTISDSSKVSVLTLGVGNHNIGRSAYDRCLVTSDIVNGSPVFTLEGTATIQCDVSYVVVEWIGSNWNLQRVTHDGVSTDLSTETIADVGSLDRAFILQVQQSNQDNSGTDGLNEQGEQVWLSATDTISFNHPWITGGWDADMFEVVYVLSNTDTDIDTKLIVQHHQPTDQQNTTGAEEENWNVSITTLTYNSTEIGLFGMSTHVDGSGTGYPRGSILGQIDYANNQVSFWQSDANQEQDYAFSVVEFPRTKTVTNMTETIISTTNSTVSYPNTITFEISSPESDRLGGVYAATCNANQTMIGINHNGSIICGDVP